MTTFNVEVAGGSSVRLTTAGKYCDRDIIVIATGGNGGIDTMLDGSITEIKSDVATVVASACWGLGNLTTVNLPNATAIGSSCFRTCSSLKNVHLPNLKTAGTFAFAGSGIEYISLPRLTSSGTNLFNGCASLKKAELAIASNISGSSFASATSLEAVILRYNGVAKLATSAFTNSGVENGTGYIYVPAEFVEEYKTATNWSTYADQIRAIEDYPDICGQEG